MPPNYHLLINGVSYSIPYALVGESVELKLSEQMVEVFHKGIVVAVHLRHFRSGDIVTEDAHRHPRHRAYLTSLSTQSALAQAEGVGIHTKEIATAIMAHAITEKTGVASVRGLLLLAELYSKEELEEACCYGTSIGATSRASISSILASGAHRWVAPTEPPAPLHLNLRPLGEFFPSAN